MHSIVHAEEGFGHQGLFDLHWEGLKNHDKQFMKGKQVSPQDVVHTISILRLMLKYAPEMPAKGLQRKNILGLIDQLTLKSTNSELRQEGISLLFQYMEIVENLTESISSRALSLIPLRAMQCSSGCEFPSIPEPPPSDQLSVEFAFLSSAERLSDADAVDSFRAVFGKLASPSCSMKLFVSLWPNFYSQLLAAIFVDAAQKAGISGVSGFDSPPVSLTDVASSSLAEILLGGDGEKVNLVCQDDNSLVFVLKVFLHCLTSPCKIETQESVINVLRKWSNSIQTPKIWSENPLKWIRKVTRLACRYCGDVPAEAIPISQAASCRKQAIVIIESVSRQNDIQEREWQVLQKEYISAAARVFSNSSSFYSTDACAPFIFPFCEGVFALLCRRPEVSDDMWKALREAFIMCSDLPALFDHWGRLILLATKRACSLLKSRPSALKMRDHLLNKQAEQVNSPWAKRPSDKSGEDISPVTFHADSSCLDPKSCVKLVDRLVHCVVEGNPLGGRSFTILQKITDICTEMFIAADSLPQTVAELFLPILYRQHQDDGDKSSSGRAACVRTAGRLLCGSARLSGLCLSGCLGIVKAATTDHDELVVQSAAEAAQQLFLQNPECSLPVLPQVVHMLLRLSPKSTVPNAVKNVGIEARIACISLLMSIPTTCNVFADSDIAGVKAGTFKKLQEDFVFSLTSFAQEEPVPIHRIRAMWCCWLALHDEVYAGPARKKLANALLSAIRSQTRNADDSVAIASIRCLRCVAGMADTLRDVDSTFLTAILQHLCSAITDLLHHNRIVLLNLHMLALINWIAASGIGLLDPATKHLAISALCEVQGCQKVEVVIQEMASCCLEVMLSAVPFRIPAAEQSVICSHARRLCAEPTALWLKSGSCKLLTLVENPSDPLFTAWLVCRDPAGTHVWRANMDDGDKSSGNNAAAEEGAKEAQADPGDIDPFGTGGRPLESDGLPSQKGQVPQFQQEPHSGAVDMLQHGLDFVETAVPTMVSQDAADKSSGVLAELDAQSKSILDKVVSGSGEGDAQLISTLAKEQPPVAEPRSPVNRLCNHQALRCLCTQLGISSPFSSLNFQPLLRSSAEKCAANLDDIVFKEAISIKLDFPAAGMDKRADDVVSSMGWDAKAAVDDCPAQPGDVFSSLVDCDVWMARGTVANNGTDRWSQGVALVCRWIVPSENSNTPVSGHSVNLDSEDETPVLGLQPINESLVRVHLSQDHSIGPLLDGCVVAFRTAGAAVLQTASVTHQSGDSFTPSFFRRWCTLKDCQVEKMSSKDVMSRLTCLDDCSFE